MFFLVYDCDENPKNPVELFRAGSIENKAKAKRQY